MSGVAYAYLVFTEQFSMQIALAFNALAISLSKLQQFMRVRLSWLLFNRSETKPMRYKLNSFWSGASHLKTNIL